MRLQLSLRRLDSRLFFRVFRSRSALSGSGGIAQCVRCHAMRILSLCFGFERSRLCVRQFLGIDSASSTGHKSSGRAPQLKQLRGCVT